jgi:hypothetical protein
MYINVKTKPLYIPQAIRKDILYIKDIINDKNEFLTHAELNRKYATNLT